MKISELQDSFDHSTVASPWKVDGGNVFPGPTSTQLGAHLGSVDVSGVLRTKTHYEYDSVYLQITQGAGSYTQFGCQQWSLHEPFGWYGSTLTIDTTVGSSNLRCQAMFPLSGPSFFQFVDLVYNPTNHAFLGMTKNETATSIRYDFLASPNGLTWTTIASFGRTENTDPYQYVHCFIAGIANIRYFNTLHSPTIPTGGGSGTALLNVRMADNTWQKVGTPARPLKLRQSDNTWLSFAGGSGHPLKLRQTDGTWKVVATAGSGGVGTVSGVVSQSEYGVEGAIVTFAGYQTTTDAIGKFYFDNIPAGTYTITATFDGDSGSTVVTVDGDVELGIFLDE